MSAGIKAINVHGCTVYQAKIKIDSELRRARGDVYRLRIIHGFNEGTEIKTAVQAYLNHPKVMRVAPGGNSGETDLILREL